MKLLKNGCGRLFSFSADCSKNSLSFKPQLVDVPGVTWKSSTSKSGQSQMYRTWHLCSKMFYGWHERRLNNNHAASAICTSYEIDGRFSWKDGAAKGRIQRVSNDEFWIRCFSLFCLLIEMIKVIAFLMRSFINGVISFPLTFHSEQSFGSTQVLQRWHCAPLPVRICFEQACCNQPLCNF